MFDRYNVINETDLAAAVAKRFTGKQAADIPPAGRTADSLSSSPAHGVGTVRAHHACLVRSLRGRFAAISARH
jgi:hypothetical protein